MQVATVVDYRIALVFAVVFRNREIGASDPEWEHPVMAIRPRLPHNAREQGLIAGANMTGKKRMRYEQIPYFWTEIFDLRMDFIGDFSLPPTRIDMKGTHAKKKFVARYCQGDKLRAILLCGASPKDVEHAKSDLRHALGK